MEGPREEEFSWELERFCELALRANPNILECLHSPLVERLTPVGEELLSLREAFLSRRAHTTFTRYAASQHGKLVADVRIHGAPRWKHAMHLLRLLLSCRDLLRTGRLTIDATEHRDRLLAVKRGELTWPEVDTWMTRLTAESETALRTTPSPKPRTWPEWRISSPAPAGRAPRRRRATGRNGRPARTASSPGRSDGAEGVSGG